MEAPSGAASENFPSGSSCHESGDVSQESSVQPWHQVPLYPQCDAPDALNVVCVFPKWNPQSLRSSSFAFSRRGREAESKPPTVELAGLPNSGSNNRPARWNRCIFPQTCVLANQAESEALQMKFFSEGAMEVLEIGSEPRRKGEVYTVRPLAALPLVDLAISRRHVSWLVVAIDVEDPLADPLMAEETLEECLPGIRSWLTASELDTSAAITNTRTLAEGVADANHAESLQLIRDAHVSWKLQHFMGPTVPPEESSTFCSKQGEDALGGALHALTSHLQRAVVPISQSLEGVGIPLHWPIGKHVAFADSDSKPPSSDASPRLFFPLGGSGGGTRSDIPRSPLRREVEAEEGGSARRGGRLSGSFKSLSEGGSRVSLSPRLSFSEASDDADSHSSTPHREASHLIGTVAHWSKSATFHVQAGIRSGTTMAAAPINMLLGGGSQSDKFPSYSEDFSPPPSLGGDFGYPLSLSASAAGEDSPSHKQSIVGNFLNLSRRVTGRDASPARSSMRTHISAEDFQRQMSRESLGSFSSHGSGSGRKGVSWKLPMGQEKQQEEGEHSKLDIAALQKVMLSSRTRRQRHVPSEEEKEEKCEEVAVGKEEGAEVQQGEGGNMGEEEGELEDQQVEEKAGAGVPVGDVAEFAQMQGVGSSLQDELENSNLVGGDSSVFCPVAATVVACGFPGGLSTTLTQGSAPLRSGALSTEDEIGSNSSSMNTTTSIGSSSRGASSGPLGDASLPQQKDALTHSSSMPVSHSKPPLSALHSSSLPRPAPSSIAAGPKSHLGGAGRQKPEEGRSKRGADRIREAWGGPASLVDTAAASPPEATAAPAPATAATDPTPPTTTKAAVTTAATAATDPAPPPTTNTTTTAAVTTAATAASDPTPPPPTTTTTTTAAVTTAAIAVADSSPFPSPAAAAADAAPAAQTTLACAASEGTNSTVATSSAFRDVSSVEAFVFGMEEIRCMEARSPTDARDDTGCDSTSLALAAAAEMELMGIWEESRVPSIPEIHKGAQLEQNESDASLAASAAAEMELLGFHLDFTCSSSGMTAGFTDIDAYHCEDTGKHRNSIQECSSRGMSEFSSIQGTGTASKDPVAVTPFEGEFIETSSNPRVQGSGAAPAAAGRCEESIAGKHLLDSHEQDAAEVETSSCSDILYRDEGQLLSGTAESLGTAAAESRAAIHAGADAAPLSRDCGEATICGIPQGEQGAQDQQPEWCTLLSSNPTERERGSTGDCIAAPLCSMGEADEFPESSSPGRKPPLRIESGAVVLSDTMTSTSMLSPAFTDFSSSSVATPSTEASWACSQNTIEQDIARLKVAAEAGGETRARGKSNVKRSERGSDKSGRLRGKRWVLPVCISPSVHD